MKKLLFLAMGLFLVFNWPAHAQEEPLPEPGATEPEPAPELIYGSIHGGGQIVHIQKEAHSKRRPDMRLISFGGYVENNGGEIGGFWQVVFHNISNPRLNKSKFQATEIEDITFQEGEGCRGAEFTAKGTLSYFDKGKIVREDGWRLVFKSTDSGPPRRWKSTDTVWLGLLGPDKATYDYASSEDFFSDENCLEWDGTFLDRGNLTVLMMTEEQEN